MNIPKKLVYIFDKLIKNGANPILVGGFVRDNLLQIDSKDIDVEVYGLSTYEQLVTFLEEFGDVSLVGKSFGVVKLKIKNQEFDFSFPRTENKTGSGHSGFDVSIDGGMSFEKAAKRRDFTINSIAYDYKNKIFLDPFGGMDDLKNKRLKHISKSAFIEDPLRVYRGIQFCARFELHLDKSTYELFLKMLKYDEFKSLAKERIFEEYKKLLLKSKKPSIGLKLINDLGIEKIEEQAFEHIDKMVKYKSGQEKSDLVILFFYLEEIIKKITNDTKLLRDISQLKDFKIPKIFQHKITSHMSQEQVLVQKYSMMKNMPKPLIKGRDLIAFGFKAGVEFKKILDELYQKQLDGKIDDKTDLKVLLRGYKIK